MLPQAGLPIHTAHRLTRSAAARHLRGHTPTNPSAFVVAWHAQHWTATRTHRNTAIAYGHSQRLHGTQHVTSYINHTYTMSVLGPPVHARCNDVGSDQNMHIYHIAKSSAIDDLLQHISSKRWGCMESVHAILYALGLIASTMSKHAMPASNPHCPPSDALGTPAATPRRARQPRGVACATCLVQGGWRVLRAWPYILDREPKEASATI